jgi:hypothetical protein
MLPERRREARQPVEMVARLRLGISTITVMLSDLTPYGARIDGVGNLVPEDAVWLTLPGMRPILAFVAWSKEHGAGLEFGEPLSGQAFAELINSYGLNAERKFLAV